MKQALQNLAVAAFFLSFSWAANAQTTMTASNGNAELDGVLTPGEWTSTPLTTDNGVTLYAMGDGEFLYMAAQWTDKTATESLDKKLWTFNGSNWSQSGNEDRIAFLWDMGLNGADGVDCTTMCHGDGLMRTNNGIVDTWHWKAARGGVALGYADDKYFGTDDRHSDSGRSAYSDNSDDGTGQPSFMAAGGPSTVATFLAADQAALDIITPMTSHPSALSAPFDPGAGWSTGDAIPGYVMRVPAGDRASVESASNYSNGTWTVEFKRSYAGSATDFTVIPGGSVDFSHEIFDNEGGSHPSDGIDATVYTLDFSQLTRSSTLTVTPGSATLDGILSAGEWTSTPLITANGVTLFSMAGSNNFYLAAQWVDKTATESLDKKLWTFNGSNWSQSGNEDRIAFLWDMGLNGADGVDCTTMCHGDGLMRTNNGVVDTWHWKAARGGVALGYADDKYFGTDDRHSDAGTSAYSDNSDDGTGQPSFMVAGGPSTVATFLAADQAALDIITPMTTHSSALSAPFDAGAGWTTGDAIPGYVMRIPNGDRASVKSASSYSNGVWTVEFMRGFAGSDHDFTVVPGGSVDFSHEIFDNEGGSHPFDGIDATIYTLDFASITGVEELEGNEVPQSFALEQNYPNPFNPSTMIRFKVAESQQIRLDVYDSLGRLVRSLVDRRMSPGAYQVDFSGDNLSSGVYFYRLATETGSISRQMILLK